MLNSLAVNDPLSRIANVDSRQSGEGDPLTGLPRRYAVEASLEKTFSTKWWRPRCSVVKVEMDDFERCAVDGDEPGIEFAIFVVGLILQFHTRKHDLAGRCQKGEFILLLPRTGQRRAVMLAQQIIWDIGSQFRTCENPITVSCGIASQSSAMTHYIQLLELADTALHAAKCRGGNRFVLGRPGVDPAWQSRRSTLEARRFLRSA
ncbi:MAG: GGDEF domain-containing protein [Planctomycetota bacterium]|jgi:diguanylate cyclase (GGDEF)-like protein